MKIWYLTSEYPPDFGGGISMYIEQVAMMFARQGHQVTVIVRDANNDSIEYPHENLRIVRFKHMRGENYKYLGYWAALAYQYDEEVKDLIDKDNESPDIIEVQEYNAIGYYVLTSKLQNEERLKNTKIVVHLHTPTFELARINQTDRYEFPTYWIGQMEKFCINAADALVTQSQFLKEQIQPFVGEKDIKVIPLPYLINENQIINKTEKKVDLLYLGRCEYRKGVCQLLESMERIWSSGHNYVLKLLGGDTLFAPKNIMLGEMLKKKYKHRIDEGKLIFKASVPPRELNNEIQESRAVIIPSLYENFPYNCIIAMSNKIPVIVSKSGGQSEMVDKDGLNGYIFDFAIEEDIDKKIVEVLSLSNNNLNEVAINGYKRIEKICNIDENYKRRHEFYNNVMRLEDRDMYPISKSIPNPKPLLKRINYEKGLLSIIIPYYNLGEYIEETLNSAISSTYKNYEIIIINDGSTDEKSLDVLKKIENQNDAKIKIITIKNGGLANARNVGAKYANGEYIAFLDADDLIEVDFYETAICLLEKYKNISFVYSWVQFFEGATGIWPTFNTEFPYLLGMNMLTAFVVVRREDFINFGLNNPIMEYGLEDFEGWVSMCENGYSGISIPKPLVRYRVRFNSMSRQFNRNMVTYLLDRLSECHNDIYKEYGKEIYNLLVANGPGYLWNNPTFEHSQVEYSLNKQDSLPINSNETKYELMRIANSRLGNLLIKIMLKLRINRLFK